MLSCRFLVSITALCILAPNLGFASDEGGMKVVEIPEDCGLVTTDPIISQKTSEEGYMEAYIQGVVDTKYPNCGVTVTVRNGDALLQGLPQNQKLSNEIVRSVQEITQLSVIDSSKQDSKIDSNIPNPKKLEGIWLPQSTVLFPTQIANPRQPCFALSGRFHEKYAGSFGSAFVIGAQFPMYRWANVYGGNLQLELEGAVFALFSLSKSSFPMINADYYVGIPLSYARDKWAYRLRMYHCSSHVGDEYMKEHRHFHRKNKSYEAVDFSADYSFSKHFRVYGIGGYVPFSDSEMHIKPFYVEYGFEARGKRTDFKQLFGQPFLAVHFENWQDVHFALDKTYAIGYEWGKINGIGRKVRLFLEYHHGFCLEGQFSHHRDKFLALCVSYGF
jgi:hypothetical protein